MPVFRAFLPILGIALAGVSVPTERGGDLVSTECGVCDGPEDVVCVAHSLLRCVRGSFLYWVGAMSDVSYVTTCLIVCKQQKHR